MWCPRTCVVCAHVQLRIQAGGNPKVFWGFLCVFFYVVFPTIFNFCPEIFSLFWKNTKNFLPDAAPGVVPPTRWPGRWWTGAGRSASCWRGSACCPGAGGPLPLAFRGIFGWFIDSFPSPHLGVWPVSFPCANLSPRKVAFGLDCCLPLAPMFRLFLRMTRRYDNTERGPVSLAPSQAFDRGPRRVPCVVPAIPPREV